MPLRALAAIFYLFLVLLSAQCQLETASKTDSNSVVTDLAIAEHAQIFRTVITPEGQRVFVSRGSGVLISFEEEGVSKVITAKHVATANTIKDSQFERESLIIILSNERQYESTVVKVREGADLALISFNTNRSSDPRGRKTIPLARGRERETIITIGSSSLATKKIARTRFRRDCEDPGDCLYCHQDITFCSLIDGTSAFGHSGGGVYNRRGQLLGIMIAKRYSYSEKRSTIIINYIGIKSMLE